jgi:hypothetical protein
MVSHTGVNHDHTKQGIHPDGTCPRAFFFLRDEANPLHGSSSHVLALAVLAIPAHQLAHVLYSAAEPQTTLIYLRPG